MNVEKMEDMIRKVQGLLAIARDKQDDAEAHTALLMARRLMAKYNIDESAVDTKEDKAINTYPVFDLKKVYWYESTLLTVIASNFRVVNYRMKGANGKARLMVRGHEEDCQMAIEIYHLARQVMMDFAKMQVEEYYILDGRYVDRTIATSNKIRDSYISGFIVGLDENFKAQTGELVEEYGLAIVSMPVEVAEDWEEYSKNFGTHKQKSQPDSVDWKSYDQGRKDGKEMDKALRTKLD